DRSPSERPGDRVRGHGRGRRRDRGRASPLRRRAQVRLRDRRHTLVSRTHPQGAAWTDAYVLLRAGTDREAHEGMGAAGPRRAYWPGLDEVLRFERRVAPRGAKQRTRRGG